MTTRETAGWYSDSTGDAAASRTTGPLVPVRTSDGFDTATEPSRPPGPQHLPPGRRPSRMATSAPRRASVPGALSTGPVPIRGQVSLRFQAGEKRRLLHLTLGGTSLVLAGTSALFGAGTFWALTYLWGAAAQGLAAWVAPGFGVVLNQRGIILRGWSTRSYPWSQVQSIESVNFFWARRVQVRLTQRPKKIRAWAPWDDFLLTDMRFDGRVEAMQQWHADHRPQRP